MNAYPMSARARAILARSGVVVLALLVAHPAWAAWPHDPFTNVQVGPGSGAQFPNSIVPDGIGGALVVWTDTRNGTADIFAQHITATGSVAPGWPPGGLEVCTSIGQQTTPVADSDGAGGVVIAWSDTRINLTTGDIFAIRVNGDGTLAAGWPVNGRQLSVINLPKDEVNPVIVSDGAGGAIVVWTLTYSLGTDVDVYAAHVTGAGALAWEVPVSAPSGIQWYCRICTDGAGGAIVSFEDNISGNFDVKAARIRIDGALPWGIRDVSVLLGEQAHPAIASDGVGGAIIAWDDTRNGDYDIFAQHLTNSGLPVPGWLNNGMPISPAPSTQILPAIVSDGGQGALIAWNENFIGIGSTHALRISVAGSTYPGWPPDGVQLTSTNTPVAGPVMVSDGAGGAIVSWTDARSMGGYDIYASRVAGTGALAPGWTSGGTPISTAAAEQEFPFIATDGGGGGILAWSDSRNGTFAAFAQRVDLFGQLGNAEPAITRIKDVPGDQGGHVRLDWSASYLDANPAFGISNYWIWRQAPVDVAMRAVRGGAHLLNADLDAAGPVLRTGTPNASPDEWDAIADHGLYMLTSVSGTQYAWEFLASQPSSGFPKYSYVASTTRDSLGAANPYTPFMVQARAATGEAFWSSAPDSGYSADNLPPAMPQPFTGALTGGDMHLHWGANSETDLGGYRLYRGSSAGFIPGPTNLVAAQPDTGFTDVGRGASYYKLSAVDIHGNASGFALLSPSGTTDVGAGGALALSLARPSPNPAHGVARIGFALPHETRVSLAIYDVAGRTERVLLQGVLPAGEHTQDWNLRDGAGSSARAGLYFVRLEAEGRRLAQRLVVSGE